MRYLDYTRIRDRSYVLIVAFLVTLSNSSICVDGLEVSTDTKFYPAENIFEPICDDEYRTNYMKGENFHPINWHGEDPDFLSIESSLTEFIEPDPQDSLEFIEHDRAPKNFIVPLRRSGGPIFFNTSSEKISSYDFENSDETGIFRHGEDRELIERIRWGKINFEENPSMMRLYKFWRKFKKEDKKNGRNFHHKSDGSSEWDSDEHRNNSEVGSRPEYPDGWGNVCAPMRRIIGGTVIDNPEKYPYMAFIDTGCGGAIIGDVWILTAAHCIARTSPAYVYVGGLDLLGGCQFIVKKVYVHPKFSQSVFQHDIGLVTVSSNFVFSPAIQPIALSKHYSHYGMCGIVTGWGAKTYKGPPSDRLHMAVIPIVSRRKCRSVRIRRGQFCAGFKEANADTCQGDSGGPFVIGHRVIGIVSYGFECAVRETPAVYTDVYHYRKWIYTVTGISASK